MSNKQSTDIRPGDWISFYYDRRIAISEVRYRRKRIGLCDELCTDLVPVSVDSVLEVREPNND